jgi:hypothetical protein
LEKWFENPLAGFSTPPLFVWPETLLPAGRNFRHLVQKRFKKISEQPEKNLLPNLADFPFADKEPSFLLLLQYFSL